MRQVLVFFLEYPSISLHAISRDTKAAYPEEHLYVMVNAKLAEDEIECNDNGNDEDDDDDDEHKSYSSFNELSVISVGEMFSAMCDCQALHPDPEDQDDSDDDFEGEEYDVEAHEQGQVDPPTFYTYEEGLSHLTPEGQANLERFEGMLASSVGQHTMAGVRTEGSALGYEDGMDVVPTVPGQFEDADVDH
ncbi:unnamed protein product [Staurois parvus]|uniref:Methylosome subunit pICln n=1 Tax=Staurois parvus TaxID=386267 RepID=A0ABN9AIN9_9NEOB|nr:unnamed protein product [Staurois parvus]